MLESEHQLLCRICLVSAQPMANPEQTWKWLPRLAMHVRSMINNAVQPDSSRHWCAGVHLTLSISELCGELVFLHLRCVLRPFQLICQCLHLLTQDLHLSKHVLQPRVQSGWWKVCVYADCVRLLVQLPLLFPEGVGAAEKSWYRTDGAHFYSKLATFL